MLIQLNYKFKVGDIINLPSNISTAVPKISKKSKIEVLSLTKDLVPYTVIGITGSIVFFTDGLTLSVEDTSYFNGKYKYNDTNFHYPFIYSENDPSFTLYAPDIGSRVMINTAEHYDKLDSTLYQLSLCNYIAKRSSSSTFVLSWVPCDYKDYELDKAIPFKKVIRWTYVN